MPAAEVLFVTHLVALVGQFFPLPDALQTLQLLVLAPLGHLEVLETFPLLPHLPPEVLVLFYDAVVQLRGLRLTVAVVKLQQMGCTLLRQVFAPLQFGQVVGGGLGSVAHGRPARLGVVDETAVVGLVEQDLLVQFSKVFGVVPLISFDLQRLAGGLLLVPADEVVEVQ